MSGPSGTESDETSSRRGLGTVYPTETIAEAIWQADPTARNMLGPDPTWKELGTAWREHYRTLAAAAMAALELREETKLLDDGMGSTAGAFRPPTRVRRWVSSWTSGSEG